MRVGRFAWNVLEAAGDDDRLGAERSARGVDAPRRSASSRAEDLDVLCDRQSARKSLEPGDQLAGRRECVFAALEELPRDAVHPAGRVQPEGVPALRAPAPADPAAFEDDVRTPGARELR